MEQIEAEHIGKMEAQLKQWGARLDELVVVAEEAGTAAMLDYRRGVDDLRAKHEVAQSKLNELRAARAEEWETIKASVESAWKELDIAFTKLAN